MKNSTKSLFISLAFVLIGNLSIAQDDNTDEVKDRDLRIEIEPSTFFLRGFGGSVHYNVTKDNNLSLGLYSVISDVPNFLKPWMFNNVEDTTDARLGFQAALNVRYRIRAFKEWESNPYVGLITGWEYFDIQQPSDVTAGTKLRVTTWLLTPYVGFEFYYFRQMLYINPQIRGVIYLGAKSDNAARPEGLTWGLILPQISLGVRI